MQNRNVAKTTAPARASLPTLSGTPPKDPDKALSEMIETIRRLKDIYERETEALLNVDTHGFLAVQDEKLDTAKQYQTGVEAIMLNKAEMRKADPALKNELERMQGHFTELSFKNMDALKRMQRTMERLGHTIRKAAKNEAKKQRAFSYGANCAMRDDNKKRISLGLSETA
jgi:prefoldin subunit 5